MSTWCVCISCHGYTHAINSNRLCSHAGRRQYELKSKLQALRCNTVKCFKWRCLSRLHLPTPYYRLIYMNHTETLVQRNRMLKTFLLLSSLLLTTSASLALPKDSPTHSDCKSDEECIPITSLKQFCRHIDPNAEQACPVVNRKYKDLLESVDCYTNVGCREVSRSFCKDGTCSGEEKTTDPYSKDRLRLYGSTSR